MADGTELAESVARRYSVLRPHLDERSIFCSWGPRRGSSAGVAVTKVVAAATGVHPDTIARGVRELAGEAEPAVRVRAQDGGRKSLGGVGSGIIVAAQGFRGSGDPGGPDSLLVWTTKSTRNLADALTELGHRVSDRTVARLSPIWDSVCRATPRSWKAASMLIGTPSSATCTSRSPNTPRRNGADLVVRVVRWASAGAGRSCG